MLEVSSSPEAPVEAPRRHRLALERLARHDVLTPDEIELIMETAEAMHEVRSRPVGKVATLRVLPSSRCSTSRAHAPAPALKSRRRRSARTS